MTSIPTVYALALLANTFWGLRQSRRLPADLDEPARRESLLRIARRLWVLLLAFPLVLFVGDQWVKSFM